MEQLNEEVTAFLDLHNHPLRKEIERLRTIILSANEQLTENIKWNGPNYCYANEDRISMRVNPPKQLQLIFHCGAKVKELPKEPLIKNDYGILEWKDNRRAVATFKNGEDIESNKEKLLAIVKNWIQAAK